jgi:transcription elongation factor Elf1
MVTFECPWCAEPAMVEAAEADVLTCEACGVRADLAPDPIVDPIARAA